MQEEEIEEKVQLLREILKWIRFSALKTAKDTLTTLLDTDQKKLIYQMSDGVSSSIDIGRQAQCSDWTVRSHWKSWQKQGLGENLSVSGGLRFKRAFDLESIGIEIPLIQASKKRSETTQAVSDVTGARVQDTSPLEGSERC